MTREQLEEFTRKLQMLSDDGVERIYETTYRECAYTERILPPAAAIQRLSGGVEGVAEIQGDEWMILPAKVGQRHEQCKGLFRYHVWLRTP